MQRGSVADRQRFDAGLDPDPTFCFDAYPASDPDPILDPYQLSTNCTTLKYKF
jgi:hypothetical protein